MNQIYKKSKTDFDILNGIVPEYFDKNNPDLLERWRPLQEWTKARAIAGLESFSKYTSSSIGTNIKAFDREHRLLSGVNFASQDYLALSTDERTKQAALAAADTYGVHSAGSAALMGLTKLTLDLEDKIATFLDMSEATVFPTGWGAGYGAIRTLIKKNDHILIDVLAHACLQEAAVVSTKNVHHFPHCSNEAVERRLKRIRSAEPDAGILVVTETVFSMDSDVPDIVELQALCTQYNATLFVDVAHDLGAIGTEGRGILEIQNMVGKIDVVMGSFSKTFASNGGFVATKKPILKSALRYTCGPLTFTNSLSPMQAAIVLKCFEIIESPEGAQKRTALMHNSVTMRKLFETADFAPMGKPSAIIPIILGDNPTSRVMTAHILQNGGIVNLVEYPAVSKNTCRWRVQVMSSHTEKQLNTFVQLAVEARDYAKNSQ